MGTHGWKQSLWFWYPVGIIRSKSRLVGEPSDRRLSSLVRRALVGLKIFFVSKCYGLNAELLTLLVWMGVHPKVFPDCMHTSVSNLVQHGKFHWEESAKKRKTGQHLNVYLRDCPRAEECPHEFVEVSTQEKKPLLYSVDSSDWST